MPGSRPAYAPEFRQKFADSNSCKLVEGHVSPEGGCRLFAAKAA